MMKAATDSPQRTRGGMSTSWMVALAIAFGITTIPATTQAAPIEPEDRLCTGGFNTKYGWFLEDGSHLLGAQEVAGLSSACIKSTPAGLKLQMGGIGLPLVDAMRYNFNASPPTLTVPLLEPSLCENYGVSSAGNLQFVVKDANDAPMFSTNAFIDSMQYALSAGTLTPRGLDVSLIRCHSALSPNFDAPVVVPPPGYLFSDGMEEGFDLQLSFLDVQGNPIQPADAVLQQSVGGGVTFRVKVKNVGNKPATDVRIREFVPTNPNIQMPVVTRTSCNQVLPSQTQCSGLGYSLSEDISSFGVGEERVYELTRKSAGTDTSNGQSMALVQVAVFSDESNGGDAEYKNNSRTLRIKVVDQTSVTYAIRTDGVAGGSGGTVSIGSVPTVCTQTGPTISCPPGTSGVLYTATASANFTFTGFAGCVGQQPPNSFTSGTFTTDGTTTSCTLTANFHKMPEVQSAITGGGNGAITPGLQRVHYGQPAELSVMPDPGYELGPITGTCGAVVNDPLGSNTWKTTPLTADCYFIASFVESVFTVTATAGSNGVVAPANQQVGFQDDAVFSVTPDPNYVVQGPTISCGLTGMWDSSNTQFTLEDITEDCSLEFEFELITHEVSVDPTIQNGTIAFLDSSNNVLPGTSVDVAHGQAARFTFVPAAGYHFNGNPGNVHPTNCVMTSLNYNYDIEAYIGVTQAITASDCTIRATFTPD